MTPEEPLTGDPRRWPHLEASYALARMAAQGFAAPPCAAAAFTAARWGLHVGLALARLDPDLAQAVSDECDDYDLARDGLEAMSHARYMMMQDVAAIARMARRFAEGAER